MENSDINFLKTIGKVITQERRRRKLKFTIFCNENDISKTTLYMIEKGLSQTYITNIYRIISAMGLTLEEFGALVEKELPEGFTLNK